MKLNPLKQIRRNPWLRKVCEGKRVLHIGCTDEPLTAKRIEQGELLHGQLLDVAACCVGLDIDEAGIDVMKRMFPEESFILGSAEALGGISGIQSGDTSWDLIIAADVVEHLNNVGLFFQGVRGLMSPSTQLVVTVPHAYSFKHFIWMLTGNEHVHPDHTAYFSFANFRQIAARHELLIVYCFGFQWRHKALKNKVSNVLCAPMVWLSRGRYCDEIAVIFELGK